MPIGSTKIMGILNVTPDSFTDGGEFTDFDCALAKAEMMMAEGADIIDIGGDSTRPGSQCAGPDEEWRRVREVIGELAPRVSVSIDTHHAAVAEEAIRAGAAIVNDVSAGFDPLMFPLVATTGVKIILMHSRCPEPHRFDRRQPGDIILGSRQFLQERVAAALEAGVQPEQIILDPGMGGFLSEEPLDSWEMIRRFSELSELGFPLVLASSRKGFLRQDGEAGPIDRDPLSALTAYMVARQLAGRGPDYVRVHNVRMHAEFLKAACMIAG